MVGDRLERKVWTVPAARIKGQREHPVPLARVRTILRQWRPCEYPSTFSPAIVLIGR